MGTSPSMSEEKKILYTAKTQIVGQTLDPWLSGHRHQPGTAVCCGLVRRFEESMKIAARKMKIRLPEETALDAEVDLSKTGEDYFLQARLNISVPGLERSVAQQVVDGAEQICTYSKAIRGNVDVTIKLV